MYSLSTPPQKLHSLESGALFVLRQNATKVYEFVDRHFTLILCVDAVTQDVEYLQDDLNVYPLPR